MMSPNPDNPTSRSLPLRHTPLQIVHAFGNFMRIWSVYLMYFYLSRTGASPLGFIFTCLVPTSFIFLVLQKPWKGRPLSNSQVVPSVINGVVLALYFVLWGKGLKSWGPLRVILAEYSGSVLGVLSAALYGRRGFIWKKVGGLVAMFLSFYLLSQGWATSTHSPITFEDQLDVDASSDYSLNISEMVIPVSAGILSALRRVIARRVSLKNQLKRRLHAITLASATCFLFPVAMWDTILVSFGSDAGNPIQHIQMGSTVDDGVKSPFPTWTFLSFVLFGLILIYHVDNIAEERLHLVFSSPKHLLVAGGCIVVMEIIYKLDFSLAGFLICLAFLGWGIHQATSLDRGKRTALHPEDLPDITFDNQVQMSPLPT